MLRSCLRLRSFSIGAVIAVRVARKLAMVDPALGTLGVAAPGASCHIPEITSIARGYWCRAQDTAVNRGQPNAPN